jgi:hypothetical protein
MAVDMVKGELLMHASKKDATIGLETLWGVSSIHIYYFQVTNSPPHPSKIAAEGGKEMRPMKSHGRGNYFD